MIIESAHNRFAALEQNSISRKQMMSEASDSSATPKTFTSLQRRVLGVLVEKAKTTPDSYPLTLNAVTTGCNQKSNRSPQMDLGSDDVEMILDELRELKAVTEVHGAGRAAKYRHNLYEWLDVDKVELAVLAELMLRGEQTVGELRGRAARMEAIADIAALRPILVSLVQRGLAMELTPPGRGQLVSHGLYEVHEREGLRRSSATISASDSEGATASRPSHPSSRPGDTAATQESWSELVARVEALENEVRELKSRLPS